MLRDTLTLILVEEDSLTLSEPLQVCTWGDCVLCGGEMLAAIGTQEGKPVVWDGDHAVCGYCGAVDAWNVDEDSAFLQGLPDSGDEIRILRRLFEEGGRAEWERRASGEDLKHFRYLVQRNDNTEPLLPPINHKSFYHPLNFTDRETMSLRWLQQRMSGEIEGFDLNLDPDYQRDHVWEDHQAEAFVGHFLEGGAVPMIIINSHKGWTEPDEVVDGKQRIQALMRWLKGEIAAEFTDGRRVYWDDLDEESQQRMQSITGPRIDIGYVMLPRPDVLRLYLRLNRGGTVHTDSEINRVREMLAECED